MLYHNLNYLSSLDINLSSSSRLSRKLASRSKRLWVSFGTLRGIITPSSPSRVVLYTLSAVCLVSTTSNILLLRNRLRKRHVTQKQIKYRCWWMWYNRNYGIIFKRRKNWFMYSDRGDNYTQIVYIRIRKIHLLASSFFYSRNNCLLKQIEKLRKL